MNEKQWRAWQRKQRQLLAELSAVLNDESRSRPEVDAAWDALIKHAELLTGAHLKLAPARGARTATGVEQCRDNALRRTR
jgi:hypothetical protein